MSSARLKSLSLFLETALVTQLAKLLRQAAGMSEAVLRLKLPKCNAVGFCRANAGCAWLQVFNF